MEYKAKTDYTQDAANADNSINTSVNGKRRVVYSRTRQCTIFFAAVVLFIAMLMVVVVLLYLRCGQMQDELQEHKMMLEHLMQNDAGRQRQGTASHFSSISKRYATRRRSKRKKRQNRAFGPCSSDVRQCINSELSREISRLHLSAKKPRIHLVGNNRMADANENTFKWDLKYSTESVHITYDANDGCVLIRRAGSYHVYSQMLITGVDENISRPYHLWYGHKTVRKRATDVNPTKTLMRSFITPYNRGQTYYANGPDLHRAVDTTYQAGVFNFHVGDKVCVQKLTNSHHVRYGLDPEAAFFGMKMEDPL